MRTNPDLIYYIIMEEFIECRTPHPSSCICVECQKEKSDLAKRVSKRILKEFQRKTKIKVAK